MLHNSTIVELFPKYPDWYLLALTRLVWGTTENISGSGRKSALPSSTIPSTLPTARTDSSRTGSSVSRRTRPGSSGETGSSPPCSPLRRTSRSDRKIARRTTTLSIGRGELLKTTYLHLRLPRLLYKE